MRDKKKKKERERQTVGEKIRENWKSNVACKKKPTKRNKSYRKYKTKKQRPAKY